MGVFANVVTAVIVDAITSADSRLASTSAVVPLLEEPTVATGQPEKQADPILSELEFAMLPKLAIPQPEREVTLASVASSGPHSLHPQEFQVHHQLGHQSGTRTNQPTFAGFVHTPAPAAAAVSAASAILATSALTSGAASPRSRSSPSSDEQIPSEPVAAGRIVRVDKPGMRKPPQRPGESNGTMSI